MAPRAAAHGGGGVTAVTLSAVATERGAARRPRASAASVIVRLAWADVLERTRRPAFLVSLLVMTWLAHGMLPPQGAGYRTFVINELYRPAYNSAWVGALVALLTGIYFLMSNTEARELQADTLEQLGYQSESATFRNAYLTGAQELRNGTMPSRPAGRGSLLSAMNVEQVIEEVIRQINVP